MIRYPKRLYPDRDEGTLNEIPSLTQQHLASECDINAIMAKIQLGEQVFINDRSAVYDDFTGVSTYQDAVNRIRAVEEEFMALPAEMRARFNNEPAELLKFIQNEENREEAIKIGLLDEEPERQQEPTVSKTT